MFFSKALNLLLSPVFRSKTVFDFYVKDSVIVFCYHDVTDQPARFSKEYNLNIRPDIFEQQIAEIKRLFHVIKPSDLLDGKWDRPAALITFDDGLLGYFDNAVPILHKYRCPSLMFLNMGPIVQNDIFWSGLVTYLCAENSEFQAFLEKKGIVWDARIYLRVKPAEVEEFLRDHNREAIYAEAREFYGPFAKIEQLQKAANDPYVYFGNHLFNHYNSLTLSPDELKESFLKNEFELKKFKNYVPFFSYPYGQPKICFSHETTQLIHNLGAKKIFSSYPLKNSSSSNVLMHRMALDESASRLSPLRQVVTGLGMKASIRQALH